MQFIHNNWMLVLIAFMSGRDAAVSCWYSAASGMTKSATYA